MNSWQFYQYVQYPENLNIHDEVQLRGLIKDYPYFQAAHLLLAKCLKNQDNYTFEKQLKLAAIYAPNRSLLYNLLRSQKKSVIIEPLPTEIKEPIFEERIEHIQTNISSDIVETIQGLPNENTVDEENKHVEEIIMNTENIINNDIIEEEIIEVNEIIEDTLAETSVEENVESADVEIDLIPELPSGVVYITETIAIENFETESIKAEIPTLSFQEWITQLTNGDSIKLSEIESKVQFKIPDVPFVIPENKPVLPPVKTKADEILERFIVSNPTISRPKAEFYNPSKAAKKSLIADEDLVSETLAKIALKQGNILKAIKIYEKLSLKFPNKLSIFASQIEKIKKENNLE